MKNQQATGWKVEMTYRELPEAFYATIEPNEVPEPQLVVLNDRLALSLGLDPEQLQRNIGLLAGNERLAGLEPIAEAYAGHQFGNFTMLGDGRAMLLGEQMTPQGSRLDIQLKGSGRTPFSRGGDGRAALGPMLREYVISEAMHGLGIPTTRSLAVAVTGEPVYRETMLTGAVLTRVAASHLRVGTFQYAAARQVPEDLQALADYAIARHDRELLQEDQRYLLFLRNVIARQATLMAKWQLVGFIHGVMNTDNVTISGETIDYGPCAFMDTYRPSTVFSSIDVQGRYSYRNQPGITEWNLTRFAEALLPLLHDDREEAVRLAEGELAEFARLYSKHWLDGMRAKLGLFNEEEQDEQLIKDLLELMDEQHADYTNTFRSLTIGKEEKLFGGSSFQQWHERWAARLQRQSEDRDAVVERMKQHNPSVIPRNHRVEEALTAADQGDLRSMKKLLDVLEQPFAYTAEQEAYANLPEEGGSYRTFCGT